MVKVPSPTVSASAEVYPYASTEAPAMPSPESASTTDPVTVIGSGRATSSMSGSAVVSSVTSTSRYPSS